MWKWIKRFFLGIIALSVAAGVINGLSGNHTSTTTSKPAMKAEQPAPPKQYSTVDVNTMMTELKQNAAAAQKKYKGQFLCIEGRIGVIDSNGDYLAVFPDDEFAIVGVRCDLEQDNQAQENFLLSVQMNQRIRVYGKVTDVGEIVGYSLSVDKFEM